MKILLSLLIIITSINTFADVGAIQFYIFKTTDFKTSVLNKKSINDLSEKDLINSSKIRLEGELIDFPANFRITNGEMSYSLNFFRNFPFAPEEKVKINYKIDIYSKSIGQSIKLSGSVEMRGQDKLSINTDWENSEFVVILIELNLKK